jgi:hypothetical protein
MVQKVNKDAWLTDAQGKSLELRMEGPTRLGRAPDNDLVLTDSTVSQHHAEIVFDNGRGFLRDLGSSNGTFVEGSRVNGVRLNDGSKIRLGQVELTFRTGISPAVARGVVRYCAECGRAIQSSSQDCPYCGASQHRSTPTSVPPEGVRTSSPKTRSRRVSWWVAPILLLIGIAGAGGLWALRQSAEQGTIGLELGRSTSTVTQGATQEKEDARRAIETNPQESSQEAPLARVPFVGCRSDGQTGPVTAPEGTEKMVRTEAGASQRLAYYKAKDGSGVLAPRGWYCFGTYGSNGSVLLVTPQPIRGGDLFSANWGGIIGPAIELGESSGDTSGRFEVARIIARVFPAQRTFVESVIAEGIEPASDFRFGPDPTDKLIYQSDRIVEYDTPPHSEGLGTVSRLKKNEDPIDGVAILQGPTPDLLLLTVRLPPDMNGLTPHIIKEIERENTASPSEK